MGQARQLMDRFTEAALIKKDLRMVGDCFAEEAVLEAPDRRLTGRDQIVDYVRQFIDGFPDARFEERGMYEDGGVAVVEGVYIATNTGPLVSPDGQTSPATGRQIRFRSCEVGITENGVFREYRFYNDQMEFLTQLGLLEGGPATGQ
jgi:predicted ester cyclase